MKEARVLPTVSSEEQLARFILHRSHLRQDGTVRPDLSVTRHLQLSEAAIWIIGENIARQTQKTLRARADVQAFVFERRRLKVIAAPEPDNSNHANVVGWPAEKPAQKILAQEITAAAGKALVAPSRTG
jgi:hypothetical protein